MHDCEWLAVTCILENHFLYFVSLAFHIEVFAKLFKVIELI